MNATDILKRLKGSGYRITSVRRAVADILASASQPLAVEDMLQQLDERGLVPNKTTVYRELDFLVGEGLALEVDFSEGKKRYELSSHGHHHHLVCTECKAVEGVDIQEQGLAEEEGRMLQEKGFTVTRHMLEFFGICKKCSAKGVRPAATK